MRQRRHLLLCLLTLCVVAAATVELPARQQAVFRSGTKTVPVYVTVTDRDGRLVPDLVRDDFQILDNGKPQDITVFANEIQPITIVVLLDRSVSMALNFRREREAAQHFVADLLPADKARIGTFSHQVRLAPPGFTSDHQELLDVLDGDLQTAGPTPLWAAVNAGMTALARQQGRRVVLVFTDGADDPGDFDGEGASLRQVTDRARAEDMMVYAIGLAGMTRGASMVQGGSTTGSMGGLNGWNGVTPQGGRAFEQRPDSGLAKIADESGGGYFELKSADDLTTTFSRVADELHHQYALGFVPEKLDGKIHKLEVRLKPPGTKARARTTYLASPAAQ